MEVFTPSLLRDLYNNLSREDKDAFLKLIATTAREPIMMVDALSALERKKYTDLAYAGAIEEVTPYVTEHAIESAILIVRAKPQITDDEIRQELRSKRDEWTKKAAEVVSARERERIKEARDPKPRKTDRDDELVRLHEMEGKTFGEIPRLLMEINPQWCGRDGKQLTRAAVEKAYQRRKGPRTK